MFQSDGATNERTNERATTLVHLANENNKNNIETKVQLITDRLLVFLHIETRENDDIS